MAREKSFVITGAEPWSDEQERFGTSLARELARRGRVLYVNPPCDALSLMAARRTARSSAQGRVLRGAQHALGRGDGGVCVLEPPFVAWPGGMVYSEVVFDMLNRRNNRRFAEVIGWGMAHLQMEECNLLIDNDTVGSFYLMDYLTPRMSVYCRTREGDAVRSHARVRRLDRELTLRCDMTVCDNEPDTEWARMLNMDSFNIGRGVDIAGYLPHAEYPLPEALRGLHGPVAGFAGRLSPQLHSAELLAGLCRLLPEVTFVFTGGAEPGFDLSFAEAGNVLMTEVEERVRPACVNRFDLCINPELRNRVTDRWFNPDVVRWLAMGKRTVATRTGAMSAFLGRVSLAEGVGQTAAAVLRELSSPEPDPQGDPRRELAASMSWRECADRLCAALEVVDEGFIEIDLEPVGRAN